MENTKCRPWAFYVRWLAVLGYAALLFYLSSLHHPRVPRFFLSDKLMHIAFYAGFGMTFIWACHPVGRGWTARKIIVVAGLGALVYGMTDEFHQSFVSGRTPDWMDLLSDLAGGLMGGGLYLTLVSAWRSCRKGKIPSGSSPLALL